MFRLLRNNSLLLAGAALAGAAVTGCLSGSDGPAPAAPAVIPAVASVDYGVGAFTVRPGTQLLVSSDVQAQGVARYLADLVARTRGLPLEVVAGRRPPVSQAGAIVLELDASLPEWNTEEYELAISPGSIAVSARDARGLFYGAVTLWQLLSAQPATGGESSLRSMIIRDRPRFAWRGFMLDVARHYMPPEQVKQLIDWMALHKLNTLHWHLTDDQGWRLEIRRYPDLTGVGAWRVPAGAAGQAGKYGGFYTQEEVRDIVRYAADRFITVVPEIEMPGHAQAAIAAYPELGTGGPAPPVSADWGVHDYLFNVDDATFAFLENVLTEVMELFPSGYIHVGGDEAVKNRWIASARVQQRMRELGIRDETALQGYFVSRIERFLRAHGRKLIGWDEILEGGLPQEATVMSWRGSEGAIEAARSGHDVVMAPGPTLYLDYLQSDSAAEPPGRPRYVTLADVYAFEPVPEGLERGPAQRILGAQLNAWTEHMRTAERVQHNAFPRVAALAEVLWTPAAKRSWTSFLERLVPQLARYEALGIAYADSVFEPRFAVIEDRGDTIRLHLGNQAGTGELRYTLDDREPTAQSTVYRTPIELRLPARVRAATFVGGERVSKPRTRAFDRGALRKRTDDELAMCERKLALRLEDDAPLDGPRAVYNIDIMDPCWIYEDADLTGVSRLAVTVGQLPFNFQIGEDAKKIPLRAPQTPHGELEVHIGGCDGERLAVLPLAPAVERAGVTELPPADIGRRRGRHDLCLRFTRHALEPMWAVDSVQLLE